MEMEPFKEIIQAYESRLDVLAIIIYIYIYYYNDIINIIKYIINTI